MNICTAMQIMTIALCSFGLYSAFERGCKLDEFEVVFVVAFVAGIVISIVGIIF